MKLSSSESTPSLAVEMTDVTMRFRADGPPALDNVTIHSKRGELLVLVGQSGSGKTTFLNLVTGLVTPTRGTIEILGTTPNLARDEISYMFARDALLPWRTASRNVELGMEILKASRAERRRVASEMLSRVGLGHATDRLPWQLSQGMRQRVALARTWARDPRLLLMDEPFSALDPQTRMSVQEVFLKMWSESERSVVLVTHDLSEALLLGDRVLLIANGRVVHELNVPFERPRDLVELALSKEFRDLEHHLWESLRLHL